MEGYVKLHRSILTWERYSDTHTKVLFIHLLLKACFDRCNHKNTRLSKGQYLTSISKLADELNLSVRNIRTSLGKLQESGEILVETSNKYSLITVAKYEDYQIGSDYDKDSLTPVKPVVIQVEEPQVQDYAEACLKNSIWLDGICKLYHTNAKLVERSLRNFDLHLISIDKEKTNLRDYKEHYTNWIRYNKKQLEAPQGSYRWRWKGQSIKTGSFQEMEKDRASFDFPGFEFEILENGN